VKAINQTGIANIDTAGFWGYDKIMVKKEKTGYKENEMLVAFLTDFKIRKQEKLFWQIVAGKIGQSYKKLKEIPDTEQAEILHFLLKLEKEGVI
jgi:hypothetical protein